MVSRWVLPIRIHTARSGRPVHFRRAPLPRTTLQRRHFEESGETLLGDYAALEDGGPRVVEADDEWLIVVPFWAAWPFETLILPRRPLGQLPELDENQRASLTVRLMSLLLPLRRAV